MSSRLLGREGPSTDHTIEMVDVRRRDSVCLGHWDVPNSYGIAFVRVGPRFEFFRFSYFTTPVLL